MSFASELRLGAVSGGKIQTEFFALCGIIVGSQQRSKMRLVSKLLKDFANFRTWREAQSSIRIQEGPPRKILLFIQTLAEFTKSKAKVCTLKHLHFQFESRLRVGASYSSVPAEHHRGLGEIEDQITHMGRRCRRGSGQRRQL